MTTLKTALACFTFLMVGVLVDVATGAISPSYALATAIITYAVCLLVASIVEGTALLCETLYKWWTK